MKLSFIGGGMMGEAILAGVLQQKLTRPEDIIVCEIVPARRDYLARTHGVRTTPEAAEAAAGAGIVVLAVKPQEFAAACKSLNGTLKPGQTVMSIMAGVTLKAIESIVGSNAIVRAIPNTPARIAEGMTVWTATPAVGDESRETIRNVLSVLGHEVYVGEEKYVDMATAVSSSGPAYVFLVIEAMIDAAVHIGLKREVAVPMVLQTIIGSARYAQQTGRHPAELRNQVTSPGGTTTEALAVLETAGLRAAFMDAIEAAYEKAQELGGSS